MTTRELTSAGIPERHARAIQQGLFETDALSAARTFAADTSQTMLVLAGPVGVGKTLAAAWLVAQPILRELADNSWSPFPSDADPRMVTAPELAGQSAYDEKAQRRLERPRLLVIDDLGTEYLDAKGYAAARFDALINTRYAASLRTVITTNLGVDAFRQRYGERITDRVREDGKFIDLPVPPPKGSS